MEVGGRLAHLYKRAFGRGPTNCRASYVGQDGLVVLLENTLTLAERNLAATGRQRMLREVRLLQQRALESEARSIVEEVLRRRTGSFMTGLDVDQDLAFQFFALEAAVDPVGATEAGSAATSSPR